MVEFVGGEQASVEHDGMDVAGVRDVVERVAVQHQQVGRVGEQLRRGVSLKDGPTRPARARRIDPPDLWPRDPPVRFRKSVPDTWIDITSTLDTKIAAMACYRTEVRQYPHPRSLDALRYRANAWGNRCCLEAAEVFMTVRRVMRNGSAPL